MDEVIANLLDDAEMSDAQPGERVVVLGLGNTILSDDGIGILAARELARRLVGEPVVVRELPWAGFSILDVLVDFDWAILMDAIVTGQSPPGTLTHWAVPRQCPGRRFISPHDMNLFTALDLGRHLGLAMPSRISLFTVEALDAETVAEELTPPVAAALPTLVKTVLATLARAGSLRPSRPTAALAGADI
jgi:hydrogenase maturation protease